MTNRASHMADPHPSGVPVAGSRGETRGAAPRPGSCDVSVIIPLKNEEENVEPLYEELTDVLKTAGLDYEVIVVDDGSKDETIRRLRRVALHDPCITIIQLRRNFGQTPALAAGIEHSRGLVIVPMDGDLQNDPHDIPRMLEKLNGPEGYDIVSGWRRDRKDKWLNRRLPSQLANWLIRRVTGVKIHDFGCTLKAYRREVIEDVDMYSELHRFLPALAVWHGAKITELVVNHRPRVHGSTKYGLRRSAKVLLDLVTVKFLGTYATKPLYFFGKLALVTGLLALVFLGVAVAQKFGYFVADDRLNLNRNVLVSLAALLSFFSVQCVLFGVMSELLVRIYHGARGRPTYRVRQLFRHESVQEGKPTPPGADRDLPED